MKLTKKIYLLGISIFAVMIIFSGCGEKDYSDCFQMGDIKPMEDDTENKLQVEYSVTNNKAGDNKVFSVTINDKTEKYSVAEGSTKSGQAIIDIGKPDTFNLNYDVKFSVLKNNKEIWSKESSIKYDVSKLFIHKAEVEYNGETAEIELKDYQYNIIDLTTLFNSFNPNEAHKVDVENKNRDLVGISSSKNPKDCFFTPTIGKYLMLGTYGSEEVSDTYHFSDNLKITVNDAILAESVDWEKNMEFVDDSHYTTSSVYGVTVTTYEMDVVVTNPSDETVYGTVTKFYVNDTAVSDEYLVGSKHTYIGSGQSEKLYNISSGSVWRPTGETNVKKFGLNIKLEDEDGNILYDGIQWLELK